MTAIQAPEKSSPRPRCWLILTFIALQCFCMAIVYLYITNEMKQIQDKYSKTGIACFLKEDDSSWDPEDFESMNDPCWQVKWDLRQFVRKINLRTYEENIASVPEKQQDSSQPVRRKGLQRVAAHVIGRSGSTLTPAAPNSKNENIEGYKITSWELSRKGHSFLSNFHLRNGELVIHQTGFYYIYSQTYYKFQELENDSTIGNKKKNKQLVQFIYKVTSYPEPILLMKSARNSCWSENAQYGLYSIYQGGIYELQENDTIFVSATHVQLINMDQAASYFGAFLVA